MIPRRLRLRNFLSYRDCELDFSPLHLATLAGKNGDGKSALLDAITWALWGEARGRVEDDRIHHGADDMRVELDFDVDSDRYRVLRKRTRGRSGALDFFQIDSQGGLRPITGGTSRETQVELNRRIHMDHQTFINSVFLVQGRSNEFTTQTPSKRKEVLRKVLGLDRYEELSRHANDRRKTAETDAAIEERLIGDDKERLAEAPAVEQKLEAVARERKDVRHRLAAEENELAELRVAATEHERRERAVADAGDRLASRDEAVERRTDAIAALERDLAAVRDTLAHAPRTEEAYAQLQQARDQERAFADLASEARLLEDAIATAGSEIAQERRGLETTVAGLSEQHERALALVATLSALREEESGLDRERTRLNELDASIQGERDAATEAQRLQAERSGEAGGYRARAQELKDHETTLSEAEGEPVCPVCRKPLGPEELHATVEQYQLERRQLGEQYKAAQAAVDEAKAAATGHQQRAADLQRERTELDDRVRSCAQALAIRLTEAENAECALPDLAGQLAALCQSIETEAFAPEARERRSAACDQLAALGYDRERHAGARQRVAELQPAEADYNALTEAKARAEGLGDRIAEAREELRRENQERDDAREALAEARAELDASRDVSGRLAAVEDAVAECRDRLTTLDKEHGRLEERRDALQELAARVEEAKDRRAAARDAAQLHQDLARAFGRDGVQAMLIEQSLPELERIANALLDQLTEGRGRTQVSLRTQRESASGKTVETLDIHISDDLGTRDYEMYSGGEKFRVDFALRIALSRLLAMRSGASLPTLIIDEGFGTQDEEGRDRLVAAINAISSEFRLILLVTHIEELRESFGRRIEVTKDPERGSLAVVR